MRPEKLTIKNIGPFRGTHTVQFSELGDFFLIYGKTGAGKTTLFDSIMYALYGNVPGSRKDMVRQMRSQFASDSEESSVDLEFSLGGTHYRIKRTLPGERVSTRTQRSTKVAEEVLFEERVDSAWENRTSTNKSETDRSILSLIKLSAEEFSRIVLLPQGEFAQFLKQNSTERKAVLAKLFPLETYSRIIELSRNRAREAKTLMDNAIASVEHLKTQFNCLSYEADRLSFEKEIESLRARQSALRQRLTEQSALLEQARNAAEKIKEKQALISLTELQETQLTGIKEKQRLLDLARKAEPLLVHYKQLADLKQQIRDNEKELADIQKETESASRELDMLELKKTAIDAITDKKNSLMIRKEQLRIAVDIAKGIETDMANYDSTEKHRSALKKQIAVFNSEIQETSKQLETLEPEIAELDAREEESKRVHAELEQAKLLKTLAEETGREKYAAAAHRGAIDNIKKMVEENSADKEITKSRLTELEKEAAEIHNSETAAVLAARLEDGVPCPVCGALDHPEPAKYSTKHNYSVEEKIGTEKRHLELLEKKEQDLEKELASRRADLRNAEERLKLSFEKTAGMPTVRDEIPDPQQAAELVGRLSAEMQKASDLYNASKRAFRSAEEIRRKKARQKKKPAAWRKN
ncbi:AAA family ATPase [Brucepastera parasyntrophica]|uniref:AAA family ATPase n=1 Tax=Brucepastera parasyntrophica TaxID=2880008 RepID=UPI00210B6C17|nr:AAA family ATPase [Brucepastera parasyntrophica]ULQ59637.1 AAA family ATPase [Brucepastera parasyntrophica]